MPITSKRLVAAGLFLALGACASSYSPTENPTWSDIGGTWDVTFTVTGGTRLPAGSQLGGSWTLTVAPNGAFSGTLTLANGGTGTIVGTETGHSFVMTTTETSPCSSGTFETPDGHALANYATMTGTFDGADCNGTLETSFSAVRH